MSDCTLKIRYTIKRCNNNKKRSSTIRITVYFIKDQVMLLFEMRIPKKQSVVPVGNKFNTKLISIVTAMPWVAT